MSMTITVDVGAVRVGYDLLDDAGAAEIQAALDLMLSLIRSSRFRALVSASLQFTLDNPFDVGGSPSLPGLPDNSASNVLPESSPASESADVYDFISLRRSDRGEIRAVSSSGKYSKYGMSLGGALQGEYLRRAGLSVESVSGLPPGAQLSHSPVRLRIGVAGVVFLE